MLPAMWPHFVNLLSRSWSNLLASLGTTTLSIVLFTLAAPVLTFFCTIVYFYRAHPRETLMTYIKGAFTPTVMGFTVPLVLLACVFSWRIITTVYKDHQDLVKNNLNLTTSASTLVEPKSRDEEIARLKKQVDDYKKEGSPAVRIYPISHDQRPGVPKLEYVMTTGKIRTPVEIVATCDFRISAGTSRFLTVTGGNIETTDHGHISATQYRFLILSPAWSPSTPLWITVFFEGTVDRMPSCSFSVQ